MWNKLHDAQKAHVTATVEYQQNEDLIMTQVHVIIYNYITGSENMTVTTFSYARVLVFHPS